MQSETSELGEGFSLNIRKEDNSCLGGQGPAWSAPRLYLPDLDSHLCSPAPALLCPSHPDSLLSLRVSPVFVLAVPVAWIPLSCCSHFSYSPPRGHRLTLSKEPPPSQGAAILH